MAEMPWSKLPSILIVEILSYIPLTDRLKASSCCKRWRACLYHPLLWKSIRIKIKYGSRRKAKHLVDQVNQHSTNKKGNRESIGELVIVMDSFLQRSMMIDEKRKDEVLERKEMFETSKVELKNSVS